MSRRTFPPGPKGSWWGLSHLRPLQNDTLGFYERMHRDYGDVVYMRLGPYQDYTFFHPDHIHDLLATKAKSFTRMKRQMAVFSQWNGDSVVIEEGDRWRRQRRILQPAFSTSRLAGYSQEIVVAIDRKIDKLPRGSAESIDVLQLVTELSTEVIVQTMFGADLGEELVEVRAAVRILAETGFREVLQPFIWPLWFPLPSVRKKRWAIGVLRGLAERFVQLRRQSAEDRGDLLSMMLLSVDEENGRGLTDEEVRDNCVTIFLAGHDTTAAGLVWMTWYLAAYPDMAQRIREEVATVLGDAEPTFDDLSQMEYLNAFVRETLRHRPPAVGVFARQAVEEVELGGYTLPRGALAHAFSWVVHHDERWFPEPQAFKPERFLSPDADQIPQYAWFPFGLGPRTCIGNHFSLTEMCLYAILLLRRVELSPLPGQTEPEPAVGVSLLPAGGLRLMLRRR